jgi:hypothetical protein
MVVTPQVKELLMKIYSHPSQYPSGTQERVDREPELYLFSLLYSIVNDLPDRPLLREVLARSSFIHSLSQAKEMLKQEKEPLHR